jgi:hypothetical protein
VLVGSVSVPCDAAAGSRYALDVFLLGAGVAAIQNLVVFDDTVVDIDPATCVIDPAVGPNRPLLALKRVCGVEPQPEDCPPGAGADVSVLWARIFGPASLGDVPIPPDITLYTCEVEIVNRQGLPATLSIQKLAASDHAGNRIRTMGFDGSVFLEECVTPVPTRTPTATPSFCVGDCDDSNDVTVDEVITLVTVALDQQPLDVCTRGDGNQDGEITVDEIVLALTAALNGCATPASTLTQTPPLEPIRPQRAAWRTRAAPRTPAARSLR